MPGSKRIYFFGVPMSAYSSGRHELSQNFLTNQKAIRQVISLVDATDGAMLEIGSGNGALTHPMARSGRSITAVEIDGRLVDTLRRDVSNENVRIVHSDFLHYRVPKSIDVIVGNIPFHITTAILRKLFRVPGWTDAVLLMQWDVARRRAGIGASTLMTAQWLPWFEFSLEGRVPASAFTPRPSVDGGILCVHRRSKPLLSWNDRVSFQSMVHAVYSGRGRGIVEILVKQGLFSTREGARRWASDRGISSKALPTSLHVGDWVDLFRTTGVSPPVKPYRKSKRNKHY